ncbi:MAG: hypothetical protein KDA41_05045 [Planctomycetales bacterium]|nr:hypothetical protein [Planctomycetales bacterium]
MKIEQLLTHHGIAKNPFAEEDAQTDPIFKEHCIASTYHPTWDKVFGDPHEPSTSVVFGEKGAGKTAMRLQIARHLNAFNQAHPDDRVFVIEYDDFNPFLDRFRDRMFSRRRRADKVLSQWKLWDHMDAILMLGVTSLVDHLLEVRHPSGTPGVKIDPARIDGLDRHQCRDLLMLAACYDQSTAETYHGRWSRLRKRLKFSTLAAAWPLAVGVGGTALVVALAGLLSYQYGLEWLKYSWLLLLLVIATWSPWLWRSARRWLLAAGVVRHVRVGNHETGQVRKVLMQFGESEIAGQPLPNKDRTDDRYEMLYKFQGILKSLGYSGLFVLVDRVDEPHLINGSAELMRALLWPMLDNKFLKQPGVGMKLLLPVELSEFIQREERDFYERARLDKQNLIPSLEWSGEALFDVANARIKACAVDGQSPSLRSLFDEAITDRRLLDALRDLRVPRHLFKFMYRLLVAHCNAHTDENPVWKISPDMFESTLAVYRRDQDAMDRGMGTT